MYKAKERVSVCCILYYRSRNDLVGAPVGAREGSPKNGERVSSFLLFRGGTCLTRFTRYLLTFRRYMGLCVKKKLLAPSEAFGFLHVLERLLVLALLSVHAHPGDDDCCDAASDA